MLNVEICEKTAVFCAAAAGIATAGVAPGLAVGAAALSLPAIWKSFLEKGNSDFGKTFKKIGKDVAREFSTLIANEGFEPNASTIANEAMGRVIEVIQLDLEALMKAGRDSEKLAAQLVESAAAKNETDYSLSGRFVDRAQVEINRRFLQMTLELTFKRLEGEPQFELKIVPFFQREVLGELAQIKDGVDELKTTNAAQTELLNKILAQVQSSGEAQKAKEAGVHEEAIVRLAQRIVKDVNDSETAFAELERAVEIAIRVQREGRTGSNLDHFVSDVLARVAELSPRGDTALNDQANALLTLGKQAGGEQGQDYLQQAIEAYDLALKVYTRADMPTQWAMTQMNRAGALRNLGERVEDEQGLDYLQQAIEAYDLALEVRTCKDMPAEWANTQRLRAFALWVLGRRSKSKQGQDYLQQAVQAGDLALEVFTRADMPVDWVMTQANRAEALHSLGERAGGKQGQIYLQQAVQAYDLALEIYTSRDMPADHVLTQVNRAEALSYLGEQAGGDQGRSYLQQAVQACDLALEISLEPNYGHLPEIARKNRQIAIDMLNRLTD